MEEQTINQTSILDTVKGSVLGSSEDNSFDSELLIYINGALSVINQLDIGETIYVKDNSTLWGSYFKETEDEHIRSLAIQYVFLKTKVMFDPPAPATLNVMIAHLEELIFRLHVSKSM